MESGTIKIHGINPLLMHNVRLANPLEPIVQDLRSISGKRKKTLEDHRQLARLEFEGGIYFDEKLGPYIQGPAMHRTLVEAGKKFRLGTKVNSGIMISTLKAPLQYDGPRTVQELWDAGYYDQRMVTIDRAKTLRTRPRFDEWAAEFDFMYASTDFDERTLREIVQMAGLVGLLDYRPTYGTFSPTLVLKKKKG